MKKLLVAIALTGFVAAAFGQGQVQFRNYYAGSASTINAPVYLDTVGGQKLDSSNNLWRAALIGGPSTGAVFANIVANSPAASVMGNLSLLASPATTSITWVNFRSGTSVLGAGIANWGTASSRAVTGADWGTVAAVQMVAWQGPYTTWADAFAAWKVDSTGSVKIGASLPLSLTLPSNSLSTSLTYLTGLVPFAIVQAPEPTSFALFGLAGAALLIFRRRK